MTIIKNCEQMLAKTFYFASQIFVEVLNVKYSLYEFLHILQKYPGAPISFPSTENQPQVFSQNFPELVLPGILRSPSLGQIFQICLVGLLLGM